MPPWQLGPIGLHRSDQLVLNLSFDCFKPPLGASGATLKTLYLALKLRYPILGGSQLNGGPMRQSHRLFGVLVRDVRGFSKQGNESLPC
jgi:hypothetical protein